MTSWLVCGVEGTALGGDERSLLCELRPAGIILFARNVDSAHQVRRLVDDLSALPGEPYVAVDLEGGRVNRLERVIGPLPAAATAAAAGVGAVAALGRAAGAACACFGITIDFAPVVDVARPGGWLGSEDRCLASTPDEVVRLAEVFLAGLEEFGVGGCLKHYPGLGTGAVDSHRAMPELGEEVVDDTEVFLRLARPDRAVMVAHALAPVMGEAFAPASLSPSIIGRLVAGGAVPVLADDLEMGALVQHGSLAERASAALRAGCHQVLLCNALEARVPVVNHVEHWAGIDRQLGAAVENSSKACLSRARRAPTAIGLEAVLRLCERARALVEGAG